MTSVVENLGFKSLNGNVYDNEDTAMDYSNIHMLLEVYKDGLRNVGEGLAVENLCRRLVYGDCINTKELEVLYSKITGNR